MWKTIYQGNWRRFEEGLRDAVEIHIQKDLQIYSGVSKVLQLRNQDKELVDIKFAGNFNENNDGIWQLNYYFWQSNHQQLIKDSIPAPLLFWKTVCTVGEGAAFAVIVVNNIYVTSTGRDPTDLIVCPCIYTPFFKVIDPANPYYGIMYACNVTEAKKAIPEIPQEACDNHEEVLGQLISLLFTVSAYLQN